MSTILQARNSIKTSSSSSKEKVATQRAINRRHTHANAKSRPEQPQSSQNHRRPIPIERIDIGPASISGRKLNILDIAHELDKHRYSANLSLDSQKAQEANTRSSEIRSTDSSVGWVFSIPEKPQSIIVSNPRHDYFKVATMDGKPRIPIEYECPIAICRQKFEYFAQLQAHWTEHPWNRGGELTPVCDGGVRRLTWWRHKCRFLSSWVRAKAQRHGRVHGRYAVCNDGSARRCLVRHAISVDQMCRSDYGDIKFFGPRTYLVAPKVVPMLHVEMWETARDIRLYRNRLGLRF